MTLADAQNRKARNNRAYYEANRDALKAAAKEYRDANAADINARRRARYAVRKEEIQEAQRQYRDRTRGTRRGYFTEYKRNRRRNDPQQRIADNLRIRLSRAISGGNISVSAVSDLGCSVAELKARLESQWLPGWSWENYGTAWVIDHFYPLAAVDLTVRSHLMAVCNYRNLRPLGKAENESKGDTVLPEAQQCFHKILDAQSRVG